MATQNKITSEEGDSRAVKRPPHPVWLAALFGAGIPFTPVFIAFIVINCIFLYRLWQLAQMSNLQIKKPSPGKAIGFSFIPYFNLYWMFILYRHLALHLNHLTGHNKISVNLVTIGLALIISGAAFNAPYIALSGGVPGVILFFLSGASLAGGIIIIILTFSFYKSAVELLERE
ncbi:MAG: hypothetical protein ACYSWY_07570 [Planctomycetota bacterium]|jgi:hypothetical protein